MCVCAVCVDDIVIDRCVDKAQTSCRQYFHLNSFRSIGFGLSYKQIDRLQDDLKQVCLLNYKAFNSILAIVRAPWMVRTCHCVPLRATPTLTICTHARQSLLLLFAPYMVAMMRREVLQYRTRTPARYVFNTAYANALSAADIEISVGARLPPSLKMAQCCSQAHCGPACWLAGVVERVDSCANQ